jgi:hypothetical protein
LELRGVRGVDHVTGILKSDFELFDTQDMNFDFLIHSQPLKVPFAETSPKAGTKILFEQQIGNASNGKILFAYNNQSVKEFVTLGEGLWQWKMTENLENSHSLNFDLLVSKIVGLIDGNSEESQFEVVSQKENYLASEKPSFAITIKNELGELAYDNSVNLQIKKDGKVVSNSSFKVSENDPFYRSSPLKEGLYTYHASCKIGDKTYTDAGSFSVNELELESKNLKADFDGLKMLATQTQGEFNILQNPDFTKLLARLNSFPTKILSFEQEKYLHNLWWAILLVLILLSVEWLARKLLGDI